MSFSSDVKEELEKRMDAAKHCQIAEFAAFMAFCGTIRRRSGGEMEVFVVTENEMVLNKFEKLLISIFSIGQKDIIKEYEGKNNHISMIKIKNPRYVAEILMTLKWCDINFTKVETKFVDNTIIQNECCKKAFLRGAFMAAGSLSDPNKFYHFEIVCQFEEDAEKLKDIITSFYLDAKIIERKQNFVVYLKEANNITDILNLMGATDQQMDLFNIMILKGISNDINRKVNCETANLNKTVEAAVKQIRDIEFIRDTVGLESLTDNLRQTACVRLDNPDMNLKDLGKLLVPEVGKSGVNHRLRKISEIAEELREERKVV